MMSVLSNNPTFATQRNRRRWPVRLTGSLQWIGVFALAALFGYTGLAKINDPAPTSDFLVDLISVRSFGLVRAIGVAEVALALWLITGVNRRASLVTTAAVFSSFAVAHAWAGAIGVQTPCGCGGSSKWLDSLPTNAWIVINTSLALIAASLATFGAARCEAHPIPAAPDPDTLASPDSDSPSLEDSP